MKCYIEIRQTDKCVACRTSFESGKKAIPVRMQDDMGYSIRAMCQSCMDTYQAYKEKQKALEGAL